MHLNTAMTDSLLPILSDLAEGRPVTADRWQALQTVPGVADVAAHGGAPLPVWQSIWEAAAGGSPLRSRPASNTYWAAPGRLSPSWSASAG